MYFRDHRIIVDSRIKKGSHVRIRREYCDDVHGYALKSDNYRRVIGTVLTDPVDMFTKKRFIFAKRNGTFLSKFNIQVEVAFRHPKQRGNSRAWVKVTSAHGVIPFSYFPVAWLEYFDENDGVLKMSTDNKYMYTQIPALKDYIDRIGAEVLNFRKFILKEYKNQYYMEKSIIRIIDNDIVCSNTDYDPTTEERANIKKALAEFKDWPKSVPATESHYNDLKDKLGNDGLFPLYSRVKTGEILMVQQRVIKDDGSKAYVPHSFWNDGEWRNMECDGNLPFYKPKMRKQLSIMVHEGAKAAFAAQSIADNIESNHPWRDTLRSFDHWGLLGGALAPHRADYTELYNEKPNEVVYCCDNDSPGLAVLQEFSRQWGRTLLGIRFGEDFPVSFDLADELPAKMFSIDPVTGEKRFTGQRLNQYMHPATRATRQVIVPHSKKPVAELTREFKTEWVHSVSPEFFIHRKYPQNLWTADEFNSLNRPFSDIDNTARLLRMVEESKVQKLEYSPGKLPGVYTTDGHTVINTYHPSNLVPEKGDYTPWLQYMEQMIPVGEDRENVYKWVATLIAKPEIRMNYSLLLLSETQGVGKTTLGERILAPIIGMHNTSFPNEDAITESSFNSWMVRKRLAVVSEIYPSNASSKVYNKLKSVVADVTINVNEKFIKDYVIDNWIHIVASSNSLKAMAIEESDRRWLVPKITEEKDADLGKRHKYWTDFNTWLTVHGGLGKIMYWAHEYVKIHGHILPGEEAPQSSLKEEVVYNNYSESKQWTHRLFEKMKNYYLEKGNGHGTELFYVFDRDVQKLLQDDFYRTSDRVPNLDKLMTIRKVAIGAKLSVSARSASQSWGLALDEARIISNDPRIQDQTLSDIEKELTINKSDILHIDVMRFINNGKQPQNNQEQPEKAGNTNEKWEIN